MKRLPLIVLAVLSLHPGCRAKEFEGHKRVSSRSVLTSEILKSVRKLRCEVDCGSIMIRGVDTQHACKYTAHNTDPEKTVAVALLDGEELVVSFKKNRKKEFKKNVNRVTRKVKHFFERVIFGDVCKEMDLELYNAHVDFELFVPRETLVELSLGAGLINIDGIDKDIYIDAGSACIRAYNVASHTYINVGHSKELDIAYKEMNVQEPKTCEIKGGAVNAVIEVPSHFCVKSTIDGSPYATRVRNHFNPCREHPDLWIAGYIGSGTVDIIQK